jgi:hypothetical protein
LGTAGLLFNGHLGAFLMVRLTPASHAEQWLPVVGAAVLIASLLPALVALVETRPRRILALVAASQAGCILAGLVSSTSEGVQGALMQWIVVGLASTGMLTVYRLVEVRYGAEITGRDFLGLAERFPRLAVFFFVVRVGDGRIAGDAGLSRRGFDHPRRNGDASLRRNSAAARRRAQRHHAVAPIPRLCSLAAGSKGSKQSRTRCLTSAGRWRRWWCC